MSRRTFFAVVGDDGETHVAPPASTRALCGVDGRASRAPIRGSGDASCPRCARLAVGALGLTALTDPTNVHMRVVEDAS